MRPDFVRLAQQLGAGPDILLVTGRTSRKEVARFKARKPEGPRKIV